MDDLISRQAAIDEWKNDFKGYINALNMPKDDYDGIMEYIDELPSAQPAQRWIPFAEHRPWEGQQILVCSEDGVMWITVFRSLIGFSGAWLPMPEPYRQEGADMRGDGNG